MHQPKVLVFDDLGLRVKQLKISLPNRFFFLFFSFKGLLRDFRGKFRGLLLSLWEQLYNVLCGMWALWSLNLHYKLGQWGHLQGTSQAGMAWWNAQLSCIMGIVGELFEPDTQGISSKNKRIFLLFMRLLRVLQIVHLQQRPLLFHGYSRFFTLFFLFATILWWL